MVKSRRKSADVSPVGVTADAFVLRSLKSRIFPGFKRVTSPARLFALVDKFILVDPSPAKESSLVVPPTVSAPVWVKPPTLKPAPVVTNKFWVIFDVPRVSAFTSLIATAAPLFRETGPLN